MDSQEIDVPIDFYESGSIAHPFTFSDALKSDKWKSMDSEERNKLFQIPNNKLKKMDEMDLALTCVFFYPRRFDILFSEHPMTFFDRAKEFNNGFDKLFGMPMSGESLLSLLKHYEEIQNIGNSAAVAGTSLSEQTLTRFHLNFICCMFASKDFMDKMSASTRSKLQLEIDRRISLQKDATSSLHDMNILYAVRARLLTYSMPVTEDEMQQIEYFIYSTFMLAEPCQDFIDLIDLIGNRNNIH